jgi:hypothetical protein
MAINRMVESRRPKLMANSFVDILLGLCSIQ